MSPHWIIESTVRSFTQALSRALVSEQLAAQPGLLQKIDPRVRVVGFLMLVVSVVLSRRLSVIAALLLLTILVAVMSRVRIASLAKRVWLVVFSFTGLIAIPALFITPGEPVCTLPLLHFTVTAPGLRTAALLVLRVETAVTMTTVLVLCTPWTGILKALRALRLPAEAIVMLAMTHRYVFLLLETTNQMFEARQSRAVGPLSGKEGRRMMASTAGVLLSKSIELSHEVYLAMLSRGFRGEIQMLNELQMRTQDYFAFVAFVAASSAAIWMGR
jgi:cobalt ECF transporter T component CbiQ